MKRKDGLVLREVCGEKVIVGEGLGAVDFGRLISLNDTAAWLWEHIGDESEIDTLVTGMCEEYDIDPDTAKGDIMAIIDEWKKAGMIEE